MNNHKNSRNNGTGVGLFADLGLLILEIWLCLLVLFTVGRFFYLLDYIDILKREAYTYGELGYIFISALRFDSSISAILLAPLVLSLYLLLGWTLIVRKFISEKKVTIIYKFYGLVVLIVSWAVVIIDHYYYAFYKDHLNAFVFEFFENLDNAELVAGGVSDVVSLKTGLFCLFLGFLVSSFVVVYFVKKGKLSSKRKLRKWAPLWGLILYCLLLRGTLNEVPLSKQDERIVVSKNVFADLLHTNPFFPFFRACRDLVELREGRRSINLDEKGVESDFRKTAEFIDENSTVRRTRDEYYGIYSKIKPLSEVYLKRKPKHIVLFFMESFSSWISEFTEDNFNLKLMSSYLELKKHSFSFGAHFPPAGGTIKNIIAANLSFTVPRNFAPSLNYHPEGYKKFAFALTRMMRHFGYLPRFFYGGSVGWHRLYQYLPVLGYEAFFAENSFPDYYHHKYGLLDGDLYKGLNKKILDRGEERTFDFVMSLSNHPPYYVPPELEKEELTIPASLRDRLLDEPEHFIKKMKAFRYSDLALGEYLRMAKVGPYFNDTLFIITGDHAFGGGVSYPSELWWKEEQIPLLLYAPGLLKEEFQGKEIMKFTTHLDLMPLLVSLVEDNATEVETFGRNPLSEKGGELFSGINYYFSCLKRYCYKRKNLFMVKDDFIFEPAAGRTQEKDKIINEIRSLETSYYNSSLHYLLKYRAH